MRDNIMSHAKEKYVAKKGKIITFDAYKVPKKDSIDDYTIEDFRHNGFDLLAWKHELIQDKEVHMTDKQIQNNLSDYGHEIGKIMVPTIIEYNEEEQCYFGLHKPIIETDGDNKKYIGSCKLIHGSCELMRYDELGHLLSIRFIALNENDEVIPSDSKCNKSLIPFINQMIYINNYALGH